MQYSRREFLFGFRKALSGGLEKLRQAQTPRSRSRLPFLRPPGAIGLLEFLQKCTRCTDCLEACPHHSIRHLGQEFSGWEGTPGIIAEDSPCYLCEDLPCIAACTTGALLPLSREEVTMGMAKLDLDQCYKALGQPCDYCVTRCPLGKEAIDWNAQGHPEIDETTCTGCGVCVFICPADALYIGPRI